MHAESWELLQTGSMLVGGLMLLLWLLHFPLRNASIVDPGWAGGLGLLGVYYAAAGGGYAPRAWLIGAMAAIWGTRLALFLLFTRILGHPEEGRYVELRRKWQTGLPLKFLIFFAFQAATCVLLSLPFLFAATNKTAGLGPLEYAGAGLWLIALAGESAADAQLLAFKRDPGNRGQTCATGLWRYSRHPNYFFEWLIWIAFALFASASPGGYWSWLCPAVMLYFLFRVTGIPATEAQALRTKGDAYRRYQQCTSVFVPWFPKAGHE